MSKRSESITLGFAIGSGEPVKIPLAHTFVTGQTQLSGKTTTLRAIVVRSGRRALAFVTKRGETFEGRRIKPFLPREGDRPIHWRLVETIVASALGQRSMKYERYWIVNAAKNAKSLEDVRRNVTRLGAKAKGNTAEIYELIGEYLDLVLPEMRQLAAADALDLQPGLNVMDLSGASQQLQAMVIRACLERINQHEEQVLTVFPEAWEFAPRGRKTPASDEAVNMARKGAVLGNFLLCDSQDIAGVDTTVRQAASVWILGVQRELNELKRTLQMIPPGIKRPTIADVTSLEVGQFIVCHGREAIRTYVWPTWMPEPAARDIARGAILLEEASLLVGHIEIMKPAKLPVRIPQPRFEDEEMSKEDVQAIRDDLGNLTKSIGDLVKTMKSPVMRETTTQEPAASTRAELDAEPWVDDPDPAQLPLNGPANLTVSTTTPTLTIDVAPRELKEEELSARGRVATLIAAGFFDEPTAGKKAYDHWRSRGFTGSSARIYEALTSLTKDGFLVMGASKTYQKNPTLNVNRSGRKVVTLKINYK